jgi:hypothetical protein
MVTAGENIVELRVQGSVADEILALVRSEALAGR